MEGFGGYRLPSAMKTDFAHIPMANIPRSSFNRSFTLKTAFDSGYLVPIFVDEVVPGDTCNVRMTSFARLSTPIAPFLDNLKMDVFFFYVPNRILWTNFKKFMGEQDNPADSTSFTFPVIQSPAGGDAVGSLADYMGIPTVGQVTAAKKLTYRADPFRAYNRIWQDWFRDQNLQNSPTINTGNGPDASTDYVLLKRGKRHDYFTSCLPWAQKATAVSIPLGSRADLVTSQTGTDLVTIKDSAGTWKVLRTDGTFLTLDSASATTTRQMWADLSTATAATINSLRLAFQLQKMYERDARGGTRYTELIKSHFGVTSPDARMQRPEYLGGGSTPINIYPVAKTSTTDATSPQGNLAAFGTASHSGVGFVKSFTEHGVILGLACVTADLTYQQGLDRMWSRSTRVDTYFPAFAHLGEQSVLNKEIYATDDTAAQDTNVFGYQERFAEMRYKASQITGKLRSTAAGTLDLWHLAQKFTSLPTLGDTFIKETPPVDRVVAVTTEPQILLDCFFNYIHARPMPTRSVPGLIDHF